MNTGAGYNSPQWVDAEVIRHMKSPANWFDGVLWSNNPRVIHYFTSIPTRCPRLPYTLDAPTPGWVSEARADGEDVVIVWFDNYRAQCSLFV